MDYWKESFTREIFMANGQYLFCKCVKIGEWYKCFHETKGYFLAYPAMGTVCEVCIAEGRIERLLEAAKPLDESQMLKKILEITDRDLQKYYNGTTCLSGEAVREISEVIKSKGNNV